MCEVLSRRINLMIKSIFTTCILFVLGLPTKESWSLGVSLAWVCFGDLGVCESW